MTSTDLTLDPDRVADLEPLDEDSKQVASLSPYAVPQSVHIHHVRGENRIKAIEFQYRSTEDDGSIGRLDELSDPVVTVATSRYTQKITSLLFDVPVDQENLKRVAARLRFEVGHLIGPKVTAKRLTYMMTASILDHWGDRFFTPPKGPNG